MLCLLGRRPLVSVSAYYYIHIYGFTLLRHSVLNCVVLFGHDSSNLVKLLLLEKLCVEINN